MTAKTWRVGGGVVASTYVGEVEAPTWEEAIARAADEADVSLCHECARKISDPEIDHFWAEDVETGDVTGEETPHDTVVKLHKQVESLKAELELAHSMHNVAVKERDAAYAEIRSLKFALEERWADCHDGSENACCKSHE